MATTTTTKDVHVAELVSMGGDEHAIRLTLAEEFAREGDAKSAARQLRIIWAMKNLDKIVLTTKMRKVIRFAADLVGKPIPIEVVRGFFPPKVAGKEGFTEFKDGGVCNAPAAAMKKGYRVRYVRSTRCIQVGVSWLAEEGLIR